jgi:hypothetical protein
LDHLAKQPDIAVLDMSPVFAQMADDAVRSGQFSYYGGCNRIRIGRFPRFPQRGDMIDIDCQTCHAHSSS